MHVLSVEGKMSGTGFEDRLGFRLSWVGLFVVVLGLLMCVSASVARASAFGELAKVGQFGTGPGEFTFPTGLAVNPENNDVFVVDEPVGEQPGVIASSFRIQEFSPSLGSPIASAAVQTPTIGAEGFQYVAGIAVDSTLKRLYVLKDVYVEKNGYSSVATEIEIYSTEASGGTLKSEGVLYKFAMPIPASDTIDGPFGLAVNPSTHDVAVLGEIVGHAYIREITSAGQLGPFYEDTGELLGDSSQNPTGLAIGPDSSFYFTVKYDAATKRNQVSGVAKLSPDFSKMTVVHQVEGEKPRLTGGKSGSGTVSWGPQVSVNPEGTVVYAMQESKGASPSNAITYEIRGMSTSTGDQTVVYGGGTTTCEIASVHNAIAAGSGGVVYALDEGGGELSAPTPYGFHLVEFGPGGSGCPAPATSFTINGHGEEPGGVSVEAKKGDKVAFVASEAELGSEKPTELVWEVAGPESVTETVTPVPPATAPSVELSHRFLVPGTYTVTLRMKVSPGTLGAPPPVVRTIDVAAPAPTAVFEMLGSSSGALTQSVGSGGEVVFDAHESFDPTGGACTQQDGCAETKEMKSYTWDFGDGSQEVTSTEPKVKHVFSNTGAQPVVDTVTLRVTSKEGVQSVPTSQPLTVQGTPLVSPPAPETKPPTTTTPPAKEASGTKPQAPAKRPLTSAQKLKLALKACKKDKSKKARTACERAAHKKYETKKHPKTKKKK